MMKNYDQEIIAIVVGTTVVLLILLSFIISFLFIYKNRQLRNKTEQKQLREKYEQEVLKTQLEIREQTLKNISEEIHDNVGQVLSLAVLNLSAINLQDTDKAYEKIEHTTERLKTVVGTLRDLSKTLDADNIEKLGLAAMVARELNLLERTGTWKTVFQLQGEDRKLDTSREIVVFRIIQESLNNIIKHARANQVEVRFEYDEKKLMVAISDNGIGFSSPANNATDGSGLSNMARRSKLIDAEFRIESSPALGTKVTLMVPIFQKL